MNLSLKDGEYLVKLARRAVEEAFRGEKVHDDRYPEKMGAFTTIYLYPHTLRGCIGYPLPVLPLSEAVIRSALAAAFEDPRFPPLQEEELEHTVFEVSVLSPPVKSKPEEVVVGKHGIIVKRGPFQGLLLPQVPVEYGWGREEFLRQASLKAGLPPNGWKDAEIYTFTARIFKEEKPGGRVIEVRLE